MAIGTDIRADMNELKLIAGKNGVALRYKSFSEFSKDVSTVVKQVCKFIPKVQTLSAEEDREGLLMDKNNKRYNYLRTISLKSLKMGESRLFAIPHDSGSVVGIQISTKRISLRMFYSFDGITPNARKYDFYHVVRPGKKQVALLKEPCKCTILKTTVAPQTYFKQRQYDLRIFQLCTWTSSAHPVSILIFI